MAHPLPSLFASYTFQKKQIAILRDIKEMEDSEVSYCFLNLFLLIIITDEFACIAYMNKAKAFRLHPTTLYRRRNNKA